MTEPCREALLTVGRLAKRFGLSRTTLLYYDDIGLLSPSGRTPSNYRVYTAKDAERLKRIVAHREAGLTLEEIREVLDARPNTVAEILGARLAALGEKVAQLKEQQRILACMLGTKASSARHARAGQGALDTDLARLGHESGRHGPLARRVRASGSRGPRGVSGLLGHSARGYRADPASFAERLIVPFPQRKRSCKTKTPPSFPGRGSSLL